VIAIERPVPVPDDQSAPYWEAAARHELTASRCSECGELSIPPDVVCPHCGSTGGGFTFTTLTGRGVVRSWTVMHHSFLPGFDELVPFVLVDVELEDQADLRVIARLIDGPDAPLHLGDRVVTAFEDLAPGVTIPAFALEQS
jgi:uncharacterized OB-fold protein